MIAKSPVILVFFVIFTGLFSCAEVTSPACRGAYSSVGDNESIQELIEEYRAAISLVKSHGNKIFLSQILQMNKDRNFVAIEEWTCKVHKMYGRP
jgi:hypothetical protein